MDRTLNGLGGILLGGWGSFVKRPPPRCQLEVTTSGLVAYLDKLTSFMFGWFKAGLFSNDFVPKLGSTIADVVPASFSGYDGERLLYGWTNAAMYGVRAKSFGTPLVWQHDGGPVNNQIFGYYVVDQSGILAFAERFCDGPFDVDRAGRKLTINPTFSTKNEREED